MPLAGWVILAVPFIILAKWVQPDSSVRFVTPLWARPLLAGDALTFYLYKLILPVGLGPDYGRPPEWVLQQSWVYLIWIFPCALAGMIWWLRDRQPWLLASAGIFVIGVLPVLGLVPFSFQYISTVADRYLYLSMLGPALALAWLLAQRRGRMGAMICGLGLGLLGIASALQARVWHDNESLWRHALTVTHGSSPIHYNLASALHKRGQLEEAAEHYRRALEIDFTSTDAHNNLGIILARQGKLKEASEHYRRALEIDPADVFAHYNLGNLLARQGELKEAAELYRRALEKDPDYADAHYNLGSLLAWRGELEEAAKHYRRVLEINSADAEAHSDLAKILDRQGNAEEALKHYEQALQLLKSKTRAPPER